MTNDISKAALSPTHSPLILPRAPMPEERPAKAESVGSLAALHGKTIAVRVRINGEGRTLTGRGNYGRDPRLGNVLRIELDAAAGCDFLLVESAWNGEILSGAAEGCEVLIELNS